MSGHLNDAGWCSRDLPIVKGPNPYGNFDRRHFDRIRSLFVSANHFVLFSNYTVDHSEIKNKTNHTCLFVCLTLKFASSIYQLLLLPLLSLISKEDLSGILKIFLFLEAKDQKARPF